MAKTAFTTDDVLTKKLWDEKLFRDVLKESYFSRFMGTSRSNIVYVKEELTKQKGDNITFGLRMRLTGAGVIDGQTLENNEESLTKYSDSVSIHHYRHAVRDDGALSRQRAMFSIDEESQQALSDWGTEKIDSLAFDAALNSPTLIFYKTSSGTTNTATAATAKAALTAADGKLTPAMVSWMKTYAMTGGGRTYIPVQPVSIGGKPHFVLLVHPDALYDWKMDPTLQQTLREAEARGSENPLFSGATAVWDGVIIHAHENCTKATDGGSGSVAWTKGVLLGASSLIWAWAQRVATVQKNFDYENEHGFAWGIMCGTKKPQFNSLDYGSFGVYLARTNISG